MLSTLIGSLTSRFVFVVGKGGVGKSTCAGAMALALADRGRRVHLLSTDPAHSIGDLFERALPRGQAEPSPCSERLVLEELDAPGLGARWLDGVRDAVAELIDRGTYLDADDAARLLDRSLPGMDEVMGAVRIVELDRSDAAEVVVVDTAPTGHTLRLLDCGTVLEGWVAGMSAMADKAGAVAQALTGRPLRLEGEDVMERLRDDVSRFRDVTRGASDFVVVTRRGDVVAAETRRLVGRLAEGGHRVAAVVDVGGSTTTDAAGAPTLPVPLRAGLVGCGALRCWGQPATDASPGAGSREAPQRRATTLRLGEEIPPRRVVFFSGKGGVGKSTCAAAYALAVADDRDVLLLGADPAGSLADVLGVPVGAGPVEVAPRLSALQLDADERLGAFRRRYQDRVQALFGRLGLDHAAALDRRVLETIVDLAPPGIDEVFALDAILEELNDDRVLVVDTAPTGHFLRLLSMPDVALSWTRAALATLLEYRSVISLEGLAEELLAFAHRVEDLRTRLLDPAFAAAVVVTVDESLPRRETERLLAELAAAQVPLAAVIRNFSLDAPAERPVGLGAAPLLAAPRTLPAPTGLAALRRFAAEWESV